MVIFIGVAVVRTFLYKAFDQSSFGSNNAVPCKVAILLLLMVVRTGFRSFLIGIAISNTLVPFGRSVDSRQYTTGPRFTASWLRVSSTSGLLSINVTGMLRSSSTTSPAFQVRLMAAYWADLAAAVTGLPFTVRLALSHQPGMRRNKE